MLQLSVTNETQHKEFDHSIGPLDFGRGPAKAGVARFVIDDSFVSRDQLCVEELPSGRVRLRNLSSKSPIALGHGSFVPTSGVLELPLPVKVTLGKTLIEIRHHSEAAFRSPLDLANLRTHNDVRPEQEAADNAPFDLANLRTQNEIRHKQATPARLVAVPPISSGARPNDAVTRQPEAPAVSREQLQELIQATQAWR